MRIKRIPDLPSTTVFDLSKVEKMQKAAKKHLDIMGARMAGYGFTERQDKK